MLLLLVRAAVPSSSRDEARSTSGLAWRARWVTADAKGAERPHPGVTAGRLVRLSTQSSPGSAVILPMWILEPKATLQSS
jgi:hypothetical protein